MLHIAPANLHSALPRALAPTQTPVVSHLGPDAHLLALERLFIAASEVEVEADEEVDRLTAIYREREPVQPEALKRASRDPWHIVWRKLDGYYGAAEVEEARHYSACGIFPEAARRRALARCQEVAVAYDRWVTECCRIKAETGLDAALDRLCRAGDLRRDIGAEICAMTPTTFAGLVAKAKVMQVQGDGKSNMSLVFNLIELAEASPSAASVDVEAEMLVNAIEREWAAQASAQRREYHDTDSEADARAEARWQRYDELVRATDRLPATSQAARHAKALAAAWIAWVSDWKFNQTRDEYEDGGQLLFDIEASLVAAAGV